MTDFGDHLHRGDLGTGDVERSALVARRIPAQKGGGRRGKGPRLGLLRDGIQTLARMNQVHRAANTPAKKEACTRAVVFIKKTRGK